MNKLYNDTAVQAIANAIRAKNGSSDTYTIAEMSTALNDLSYYAKPTISNLALATFEADGLLLNSLKASIVAKQASGTPSPSNPLPISGWDAANVSDVGKNLCSGIELHSFDGNGLNNDGPNNRVRTTGYIKVTPSSNYTVNAITSVSGKTVQASVSYYETDDFTTARIGFSNWANVPVTVTIPSGAKYVRFLLRFSDDTDVVVTYFNNIQLELGSTPTTYEPYINQTTTISLGQTVYGGEVDVVNGILKITDGYIASYNGETLPAMWISSMNEYVEGTTPTTGAEVCYELANPIIINLTPTLIKSLEGTNNLSVDCGDVIELEYFKEV